MTEAQAAGWWCRRCGQPVRLEGGEAVEEGYRKAVHAATGLETGGPEGHLAAPVDHEPPLWKAARELAGEYEGAFTLDARFGFLRADWKRVPPGDLAAHFEADGKEQMRRRLDAAVAAARLERDTAAAPAVGGSAEAGR
jgi:hypothetical protein